MTLILADILGLSQSYLLAFYVIFLRIGAAFLVLPGFAEQFIPTRVRLGSALAVAAILTPASPISTTVLEVDFRSFAIFNVTEPVAGLLIGLAVRFVVHAIQVAGAIAAQSASLSQIAAGVTPEPQPAISGVLLIAGVTLAVISGLHIHIVHMLLASYEILPLGILPEAGAVGRWGTDSVAASFSLAFTLAAPFVIASVLYNLALGVINKAMPQLMVAFVGAPAITFGGLFLLFLSVPFLLPVWHAVLLSVLADPMAAHP